MNPHIHISALEGVVTGLYVIVLLGIMHIIARKFQGHPLADSFMSVFC